MKVPPGRLSGIWLEGNLEAESFEAADAASLDRLAVALIEVRGPQVLVGGFLELVLAPVR